MIGDANSPNARTRVLIDAVAARTGGGGTFVISQLTALARGDEFDLTVFATGSIADELVRLGGLTVRRPPPVGLIGRLLWEHVVLAHLSRQFDVLYCTGNFALPLARVAQVVTMQNALHFGADARRIRRTSSWHQRVRLAAEAWLARATVRRAFALAPVSDTLRAAITEDTGEIACLRVLPAATPTLPHPKAIRDSRPYVISVAHDHPHKDWDHLIGVFAQNPDLPPLLAVGAFTPDRRKQLLARVPPDRVRFRGVVEDRAELAGLYAAAECCVVHSRIESFGLTALEALAAGVPVLASDIPAHREVCADLATLYDPADAAALAMLLRVISARAPDAGPRRASRTWGDNANELAALLHAAAAQADSTIARNRATHESAEN